MLSKHIGLAPITKLRPRGRGPKGEFMEENWRPVPELDGYWASDLGAIRHGDRVLRPNWTGYGYTVAISTTGPSPLVTPRRRTGSPRRKASVGRLVLLAWGGRPTHPQFVAGYKDSDPRNVRADNLQWATWQKSHRGGWKKVSTSR